MFFEEHWRPKAAASGTRRDEVLHAPQARLPLALALPNRLTPPAKPPLGPARVSVTQRLGHFGNRCSTPRNREAANVSNTSDFSTAPSMTLNKMNPCDVTPEESQLSKFPNSPV